MSRLTNPHIRRIPTEHRITVMETLEDQHYYGRTYDNYPNEDGTVTRRVGLGYETERVPFMGMYLIEELDSEGRPSGVFDLITVQEFREQFEELSHRGLEYGVRGLGVRSIGGNVEPAKDILSARVGAVVLQCRMPAGTFEVVSRPAGSDDEWTVVGR